MCPPPHQSAKTGDLCVGFYTFQGASVADWTLKAAIGCMQTLAKIRKSGFRHFFDTLKAPASWKDSHEAGAFFCFQGIYACFFASSRAFFCWANSSSTWLRNSSSDRIRLPARAMARAAFIICS